ncbi:MAG TPA: pseudouridine synthase [Bacteroidia bacterium]|jgi:23S rRNA pseudouridine2457 synthase|nr:pseudouridine synthase [Bacteroidia bacterium]
MAYQYFAIYKPYGTLSQFTPEGNKPALGSHYKFPIDCYPVGRLDTDSEGLLLLTNDKRVNALLLTPDKNHERTYYVEVDGQITEEAVAKLSAGVTITVGGEKYNTLPAKAKMIEAPSLPPRNPPVRFRKNIPTSWIELTLNEGKNRQVRHMTAAVGFPTLRLVRYSIGNISIDGMLPADVRIFTPQEFYSLLKIKQ